MLEFIILMVILMWLQKIPVGYSEMIEEDPERHESVIDDNSSYVSSNQWDFKSLDDCMEFRDLRETGWQGNAIDFYKWKEEE